MGNSVSAADSKVLIAAVAWNAGEGGVIISLREGQ